MSDGGERERVMEERVRLRERERGGQREGQKKGGEREEDKNGGSWVQWMGGQHFVGQAIFASAQIETADQNQNSGP